MKNVAVVLPYPLMALNRAVFVYINGQIHASVRMKSPAISL